MSTATLPFTLYLERMTQVFRELSNLMFDLDAGNITIWREGTDENNPSVTITLRDPKYFLEIESRLTSVGTHYLRERLESIIRLRTYTPQSGISVTFELWDPSYVITDEPVEQITEDDTMTYKLRDLLTGEYRNRGERVNQHEGVMAQSLPTATESAPQPLTLPVVPAASEGPVKAADTVNPLFSLTRNYKAVIPSNLGTVVTPGGGLSTTEIAIVTEVYPDRVVYSQRPDVRNEETRIDEALERIHSLDTVTQLTPYVPDLSEINYVSQPQLAIPVGPPASTSQVAQLPNLPKRQYPVAKRTTGRRRKSKR